MRSFTALIVIMFCVFLCGCPSPKVVVVQREDVGGSIREPIVTDETPFVVGNDHDSFLAELNEIAGDCEEFRWSWGPGKNHDELILTLNGLEMTSPQNIEMSDIVSRLYHLKMPENDRLRIIIKVEGRSTPTSVRSYEWASSESRSM